MSFDFCHTYIYTSPRFCQFTNLLVNAPSKLLISLIIATKVKDSVTLLSALSLVPETTSLLWGSEIHSCNDCLLRSYCVPANTIGTRRNTVMWLSVGASRSDESVFESLLCHLVYLGFLTYKMGKTIIINNTSLPGKDWRRSCM